MKYEYGKEYETNGEKPELADDVLVHAFDFVLMYNYHREVEDINWSHVNKFRIVDERFKPKADESSWHERGELPPVKSTHKEFELIGLGYYKPEFEITAHHYNGVTAIASVKSSEGVTLRNAKACHFRPIPTERDKLVDECVKILGGGQLSGDIKTLRDQAELLVSKNWRPIKQQTEEEFCECIVSETDMVSNTWGALYRAGCRFIEQGE